MDLETYQEARLQECRRNFRDKNFCHIIATSNNVAEKKDRKTSLYKFACAHIVAERNMEKLAFTTPTPEQARS